MTKILIFENRADL